MNAGRARKEVSVGTVVPRVYAVRLCMGLIIRIWQAGYHDFPEVRLL